MPVLRGNYPAKIDDKSRLKIPTAFRTFVEEHYGPELYVTSIRGDSVRIYPLAVWVELERKLEHAASLDPSRQRFLARVSYFGQVAAIDRQGRVVIHARLREAADMSGEVDVLGQINFLEVWNHERFVARLERDPFTDDDARELAKLGI